MVFRIKLIDKRPSIIIFKVNGKKSNIFKEEAGLHQWQRVPPTEKRGRVHTSTITVAVIEETEASNIKIDKKDIEWKTCRGSGAGGQHRNVTDSAVQLTHKPSGIQVRCESERSQHANKEIALQILHSKLKTENITQQTEKRNKKRKSQIRGGHRGVNKIRTIKRHQGVVINNQSGCTIPYKDYMKGKLDKLI